MTSCWANTLRAAQPNRPPRWSQRCTFTRGAFSLLFLFFFLFFFEHKVLCVLSRLGQLIGLQDAQRETVAVSAITHTLSAAAANSASGARKCTRQTISRLRPVHGRHTEFFFSCMRTSQVPPPLLCRPTVSLIRCFFFSFAARLMRFAWLRWQRYSDVLSFVFEKKWKDGNREVKEKRLLPHTYTQTHVHLRRDKWTHHSELGASKWPLLMQTALSIKADLKAMMNFSFSEHLS